MVRPQHEPQDVGRHETDEGYRPADRHGGAGCQGGGRQQGGAGQPHANTHRTRLVVAEHQQVQVARHEDDHEGRADYERSGYPYVLPRAGVEPARKPEQDLPQRLVVRQHDDDRGDDGSEEGVDRDSRKQKRRHGEPPAHGGYAVDEERRRDGPRECEGRQREKEQAGHPRGDGRHRPNRSPRGHADDARIGHRVAEQALHRRPRNAQSHADRRAHDDPRKPDLLDDEPFRTPEVRQFQSEKRQQNGGDVACGNADRPDTQRNEGGRQNQQKEGGAAYRQPGGDPGPAIAAQSGESGCPQQKRPPRLSA